MVVPELEVCHFELARLKLFYLHQLDQELLELLVLDVVVEGNSHGDGFLCLL